MRKIISMVLVVCFLSLVFVIPSRAESLYKDETPLLRDSVLQKEASFEVELKKIKERQNSGRTIFFAGCGLGVAYLAGLYFSKTVTLEYYLGIPLVVVGLVWYGFFETEVANREEAKLMYERQMKGNKEVE